ncbi:MAG: excinuclease ABC subunit C, partial [Gammaproteobacteria bacterium]|nr:excinuclease ABC subunit C [Gammaproteobacteria bacterium]
MNKSYLKSLTSKPGIYKMLDKNKNIIYVGKASNLKNRVKSYFTSNTNSIKTNKLIEKIDDIDLIITKNEQDALILENNLIKKYKPKYNILLRDDKSYPYIFVDTKHTFPAIKFYRGNRKKPGKYFGPYTSVHTLRYMLNLIQKIFKIRQCDDTFFNTRKN